MIRLIRYFLVSLFLVAGSFLCAQTLDVHILNIRNTKGQICAAIFADQAGFKTEKPYWNQVYSKKNILNGELHIQIPFHAGEWGFSVLDDENNNGKMDYNFIGIPREGFGFSNFIPQGLHRPVFKDFSFTLTKNETKIIIVRMKYL
jgi:uncharacterized protein (DUF2141 family)